MRDQLLKLFDLLNARDREGVRDHARGVFAPDAEMIEPGVEHDLEHAIAGWVGLLDASDDLHFDIVTALESPDRVVIEAVARGTHTGLLGRNDEQQLPATGRPFSVRIVQVSETEDGRVLRWRSYWDRLGLLEQLGVAPSDENPGRPT